jgi:hypothetical protein
MIRTDLSTIVKRLSTCPLFIRKSLECKTQIGRFKHNEGEIQENERHFCVVRAQSERLRRVLVVGDVYGIQDRNDIYYDGHPGRRIVVAAQGVGVVVDGAGEREGHDGEHEHDHADDGRDHGVVHQDAVVAHELPLPLGGAEQPEALEALVVLVLVDGFPLGLEVGHVLLHPRIVDDLAAAGRDGAVGMVAVVRRRLGELLPLLSAVADGRAKRHGGAFAGVVELAAGDGRLGRGQEVVRGVAGRRGRAREQQRGHVGVVVLVGGLHPGCNMSVSALCSRHTPMSGAPAHSGRAPRGRTGQGPGSSLPLLVLRIEGPARRRQRVGSARHRLAVALADDALALTAARGCGHGAHAGLRAVLRGGGRGGRRRDGRGQQLVAGGAAERGLRVGAPLGGLGAEEGCVDAIAGAGFALPALGHGLASHCRVVRGLLVAVARP